MKQNNSSIYGMVALASFLASEVFAYLATTQSAMVYGALAILMGGAFVWSITACISITAAENSVKKMKEDKKMKNTNDFNSMMACISFVASVMAAYVWGTTGTAACGVIALLCGGAFTWIIANILSAIERRERATVVKVDFNRYDMGKAA